MTLHFFSKKIIFIAVFMSLAACLQVFADHFIYWRPALLQEFWRLWTAHWVHVGWVHYLLNILAFACLPFIFPRVKTWHFVSLLLLLPPAISFSFYFLFPHIEAYAGLSGVLHGAYMAVAVVHLLDAQERRFAALVLLLILAKLLWENTFGSKETAELIGSPVLVEAHLLGVIWGAGLAMVYLIYTYSLKK
ncbi:MULTISPECIES: rhombosortase [Acinetobacter]|uniref:Rhombosortase n=1 Tax=Acinetobacter indicus TaxID=756892 RepID=A0A849NRR5_9GAMM|nr:MULTISPECIES: rhombosortase [Acinetobacter]NOJ66648.1 rhombosortase [Acinetobacter indicus]QFS18315.1 rhombosortase [Acinetobacter indicus]QIC76927.1 rhombosortase [Acinetobacter indicus]QIC79999.1 rhombosortase [Acinetobacter indicus]QOW43258.1 rhombosortase [Acinetobacter indicus]